MLKTALICLSLFIASMARAAVPLASAHALVVDEASGEVLIEKDASTSAPIASMTKLMTAMVVLDAKLPPQEMIRIEASDLDGLKHTRSGVPVGSTLPREALLRLALIASDNHAAAALARTFPGGHEGFISAVRRKVDELKLDSTSLEESTGLSPNNHASARDMVRILQAAATYPEISQATSQSRFAYELNGRQRVFHNTNGLVGKPGWDILLSKTGFTSEAGRCLSMRLQAAGRSILVVLMGAVAASERNLDAQNIVRVIGGQDPVSPKLRSTGHRNGRLPRL